VNSIRRRLTLTILTGFGALLIFSSATIFFVTRATLLHDFDAGLQAKALTLMSLTEQGRDGIQVELPTTVFQGLNREVAPQFYELWQTNGTVCARSASLKDTDLPQQFGASSNAVYWNLELPGGLHGRALGLRFLPKAEDEDATHLTLREAIIVVAADRQPLDQTLATLATVLAGAGLLTILVTVPLVRWSLRRGHAPLGELACQAAAITADSLQTRFPVASLPEELRPIATRLNDLLGRLQASFDRERRFSAEVALEWPEGEAPEKHRETLAIALQMEGMVTRLLELTRCENGKTSVQPESFPLAPLLEEVWQPLARKAAAKPLAVVRQIPEDIRLHTDRALFRAILVNLLANAVEYTPPGGRLETVWSAELAELAIANTVHDLTPADLPHLFERLWRKDPSRTGHDHCGLGLPLSRAFAELLGYNLTARFDGDQILILSLTSRQPAAVQ
jgi:signal transduction histidine kinase